MSAVELANDAAAASALGLAPPRDGSAEVEVRAAAGWDDPSVSTFADPACGEPENSIGEAHQETRQDATPSHPDETPRPKSGAR